MRMAKFFNKFLNVIGLEEREDDYDSYEDEMQEETPRQSYGARGAQQEAPYNDRYYRDEVPQQEAPRARQVRNLDDYRREREAEPQPQRDYVAAGVNRGGRGVSNAGYDAHQQTKIYQMSSYDEATAVIDNLLRGVSVLLNLERLEVKESQRIIDTISGAAYALNATLKRVAAKTFLVAPNGVDVYGGYAEEEEAPAPAAAPQAAPRDYYEDERRY